VPPEFCGKGFFASFVHTARSEPWFPFDRIEIEAVQHDRFAAWLARNGFLRIDGIGSTGGAGRSFIFFLFVVDVFLEQFVDFGFVEQHVELRRPDGAVLGVRHEPLVVRSAADRAL
jgi:hypothetical protein